ncbi:MAG TPA: UDP-N-acetylglucosamine 2-epimerase [Candidatus Paceibacterota bacterium]
MKTQKDKQVLIITGTRATYGLWRPIIQEFVQHPRFELKVLATGMHTVKKFGYTQNEIVNDGFFTVIIPVKESDDMLQCLTKEISGIRDYCLKNQVDVIGVLGDRDEELAGAIVGAHLKIPIFHIAGGDVTGPVIDEPIRHSVTHFSHIHFPTCQSGYERILMLGEEEWRVFNVGAPGLAGLAEKEYLTRRELADKYGINPEEKWFLVIHHPTPLDSISFVDQIIPLLEVMSHERGEKIVIYPNSDTGSNVFLEEIEFYRNVPDFHLFKSLNRDDYLAFMKNADVMIGNSSSGIVESTVFHTPTVNVGNRQGDRERGVNVLSCNYGAESVNWAVRTAISEKFRQLCETAISPYGDGKMASRVVEILDRYIDDPNLLVKKIFADNKKGVAK